MGQGIRYSDKDIKKQYDIVYELMSCGLSYRRACASAKICGANLLKRMTTAQKENLILLKHIKMDYCDLKITP